MSEQAGADRVDPGVEHLTTSGKFELDGGSWDVDNNVWILGDGSEVIVLDAAHDASAIRRAVGDRNVLAVVCTHAHNDHVNAAPALADALDAPILLHPADRVVWELTHPDRAPDGELAEGEEFSAGGVDLRVLHTPGHSPGSVCLYAPELSTVFTGDTLFQGGPGATGRSYSDYGVILESIGNRLFTLPGETTVRTGHGDGTKIGDEAPHLEEWKRQGS